MKIGILGYGIEGKSTMDYLLSKGEKHIVVLDKNPVADLPQGVELISGDHYMQGIHSCDCIYRTPGISPFHPELVRAAANGVRITSHINEFFAHVPCPVIGVTGTKGKGTTSTLIHDILKANNRDVHLGGNIGIPALSFLDQLTPDSFVVLELSSFQLQDCQYSPHIAVVLNVTSDHLDYHSTIMEYVDAKSSIVRFQKPEDICVYNEDYLPSRSIVERSPARRFPYSTQHMLTEGVSIIDGTCSVVTGGKASHVLFTEEFGLLGTFNYENIAPAVAVASLLNLLTEATRDVIRNFRGLPHRLEYTGEIQGVMCYNDSFATVPDTTIAAISAFPDKRKVLILGGSEKHADYTGLMHHILQDESVRGIIFLGHDAVSRMESTLLSHNDTLAPEKQRIIVREDVYLPTGKEGMLLYLTYAPAQLDLSKAMISMLDKGEVMLLSPGCASFDIFNNYKERGQFFKDTVSRLITVLGGSRS